MSTVSPSPCPRDAALETSDECCTGPYQSISSVFLHFVHSTSTSKLPLRSLLHQAGLSPVGGSAVAMKMLQFSVREAGLARSRV